MSDTEREVTLVRDGILRLWSSAHDGKEAFVTVRKWELWDQEMRDSAWAALEAWDGRPGDLLSIDLAKVKGWPGLAEKQGGR